MASTSQDTQFVLDALEQAFHARRPSENLIHHSDRGSQYVSIKYTERLVDAGLEPSVGSVGDSYNNVLAETMIGLFKTEVINRLGPWKSKDQVRGKPSSGSIGSTRSGFLSRWDTSHSKKRRTHTIKA